MLLNWIKSNRWFIVLLLCFGVFRTAVADWNPIPSGSMRPTLLEGDVVLVNRLGQCRIKSLAALKRLVVEHGGGNTVLAGKHEDRKSVV